MKYRPRSDWLAVAVVSGLVLAACGGGGGNGGDIQGPNSNPGAPEAISISPEDTGDGWTTSSPTAEGIDQAAVLTALESIREGSYPGVDSMVIVRHGRLVAEGYFNGFARESLHDLRSTGKSFTSALAGIAIEQSLIAFDEPISQIIPGFERHAGMDARKRAIKISNLLNMDSGLACNDWVASSVGNEERMYDSPDWIAFVLDLPMVNEPGSVASYCTGGVVVLGHAISVRSGMTLDDFASTWLFTPLGIQQAQWRRSPDGRATGGGGLWLAPRDAAKFGMMYLNGGTWNGTRVVPQMWVEQSQQRVHQLGEHDYGLLWWKRTFVSEGEPLESFFTSGNGGNYIFVLPDLQLVVVFTGSNYNSSLGNQPFEIMSSRIVPAVQR